MKPIKTIPAGEFKTRCLGILDEVQRTGDECIITKYGKPVARIAPLRKNLDEIRSQISTKVTGEIVESIPAEDWGDLM